MGLADVIPARRALCADVPYNVSGNAVLFGQFVQQTTTARRIAYRYDVFFRELAIWVCGTALRVRRAMSDGVRHIFLPGSPTEVFGAVVRPVSIGVRNIGCSGWRRPMEGLADQAVQLAGLRPTIDTEVNEIVAPAPPDRRAEYPITAPDAAQTRHLVQWRRGAGLPHLCGHRSLSRQWLHHNTRNRTDKAALIANHAEAFQGALEAGGWQ